MIKAKYVTKLNEIDLKSLEEIKSLYQEIDSSNANGAEFTLLSIIGKIDSDLYREWTTKIWELKLQSYNNMIKNEYPIRGIIPFLKDKLKQNEENIYDTNNPEEKI